MGPLKCEADKMKTKTVLQALALLAISAGPLSAADSLQCYSYPVEGKAPGVLGESLESDYQMRFNYAQQQGANMAEWQDTAMFAFMVVFHGIGSSNQLPDPKDGNMPDPQPVDSLSPRAFQAWAQILFTEHTIYDYYDPGKRLVAPAEPNDTFRPLLGTRATMLAISKECFTRTVDAGNPNGPVILRARGQRGGVSKKSNSRAIFNIAGRKGPSTTSSPSVIFFAK